MIDGPAAGANTEPVDSAPALENEPAPEPNWDEEIVVNEKPYTRRQIWEGYQERWRECVEAHVIPLTDEQCTAYENLRTLVHAYSALTKLLRESKVAKAAT